MAFSPALPKFMLDTQAHSSGRGMRDDKNFKNRLGKMLANQKGKIQTTDLLEYVITIYYAAERGSMGIWDKKNGIGIIKRRIDNEDGADFLCLELMNPLNQLGTFIQAPKSPWNSLHVTHPHLFIYMKHYRRNFGFEVMVIDSKKIRRRFSFSTWFRPDGNLRNLPSFTEIPLRLEVGWNEIHVDFAHLLRQIYGSIFVELARIKIYANCRLRQVMCCSEDVVNGEILIPLMSTFNNVKFVVQDYKLKTNPNEHDPGPDRNMFSVVRPDPTLRNGTTRVEKDLILNQKTRYAHLDRKNQLVSYINYFNHSFGAEKRIFGGLLPWKVKEVINKDTDSSSEAVLPSPVDLLPVSENESPTIKPLMATDGRINDEVEESLQSNSGHATHLPKEIRSPINLMDLLNGLQENSRVLTLDPPTKGYVWNEHKDSQNPPS